MKMRWSVAIFGQFHDRMFALNLKLSKEEIIKLTFVNIKCNYQRKVQCTYYHYWRLWSLGIEDSLSVLVLRVILWHTKETDKQKHWTGIPNMLRVKGKREHNKFTLINSGNSCYKISDHAFSHPSSSFFPYFFLFFFLSCRLVFLSTQ